MKKILKEIIKIIFFSYKNIFNFVLSKILIVISSLLIAFLTIIPFILFSVFLIYSIPSFNYFVIIDLLRNVLILIFLYFFIINIRFLFAKLSLNYINGEKMKITFKNFINLNLIIKNIQIGFYIFLGILLITIFYLFILLIFIYISGGVEKLNNLLLHSNLNYFLILSSFIIIFYICSIIYFIYRVYFSFYILLENKKKSVFKIIKKSISKTKKNKKIFKLILIFLLYFLILFPYNYYSKLNNFKLKNITNYISIKKKIINNQEISEKEKIDYIFLEKEYGNLNNKEIFEKYNKISKIYLLYFIIYFILILGIIDFIMVIFYKKEIK